MDGHIKYLSEILAKNLDADLLPIIKERPYPKKGFFKYFIGGMDATFKRNIVLKQPLPDPSSYDVLVLATPVHAGTLCSPIYSFLKQVDMTNKKVYLIAHSRGGDPKRCLQTIKDTVPSLKVLGESSFIESENLDEQKVVEISQFIKDQK